MDTKTNKGMLKSLYMVNWSIATKPRDQGGLGIRDLRVANQALLMKWMWNWHDHSHAWWKQPSQMANESDRPWDDSQTSHFWKSINSIAPAFTCSVRHQIGDGRGTKFWHDSWQGTPLKYIFPNLYEAMQNKHASVSQCVDTDGWLMQSQSLNSLAQNEKDRIILNLQHLQITQQLDSILWLRNSGNFSVNSAYNFLAHTPSPTSALSKIWTIKAPPRVTVFTWLIITNRLATIDNLVKRGWQLPNMCVLCKRNEETVKHLFQHCLLVKEVRNYIYTTISAQNAIQPKFITAASFDILLDLAEKKTARQWEIVTCFILWREQCRRVFSDKADSQMTLVREIRTEYKHWF